MQAHEVRWGILGPGTIAKAFACGVAQAGAGKIIALASRSADRARAFAGEMKLDSPTIYDDYAALLADDRIHAVYIATLHPDHARLAIAAAYAGRHVFVEKPAGLNHPEVMAAVEAARVNGTLFLEAFKDRAHPQLAKVRELLQAGVIGQPRFMHASFGFGGAWFEPTHRLFDKNLAGGGILDVGCYPIEYARAIAGAIVNQPFADPVDVRGVGHLGETGIDEVASASLRFKSGFIAEVSTAIRANLDNVVAVYGSEGHLRIPNPWLNDREKATASHIEVHRNGEDTVTHTIDAKYSAFGYEALAAAQAVANGQTQGQHMTWADSLGQAATLDAWRKQIGLQYPHETPEGFTAPINGQPLGTVGETADKPMAYGHLAGLDKPIAKLIMGCDNQTTFAHCAVMFDDYWQRGGNAFDTAFIYGGGLMEQLVGRWIKSRGVRDQAVIIAKGIHTPFDAPQHIGWQLDQSLDRLQTDHADVYLMHRDNPAIAVGEFIDVLHDLAEAGRIGAFGGSNWSLQRIAQANAYAEQHGKRKMTASSNNFSLARMVKPVWTGCVAASDPDSVAFLTQHQLANFAWSSQARGFFVSRDAVGMQTPWEADGPFISDDNKQRRQRAFELAEQYGVSAINIAAAYVVNQPFPSFALIGPRTLEETATSMPALSVKLSEQELAYLDLRADSPTG